MLRFLAQRFPEAEITACEIQRGPVQFCVRTFGAQPAYSSVNLDEVELGKKFDLIWCGSLVTHLNERDIVALFRLFARHLTLGGLAVFTTHGDFAAGGYRGGSLTTQFPKVRSSALSATTSRGVTGLRIMRRSETGECR